MPDLGDLCMKGIMVKFTKQPGISGVQQNALPITMPGQITGRITGNKFSKTGNMETFSIIDFLFLIIAIACAVGASMAVVLYSWLYFLSKSGKSPKHNTLKL